MWTVQASLDQNAQSGQIICNSRFNAICIVKANCTCANSQSWVSVQSGPSMRNSHIIPEDWFAYGVTPLYQSLHTRPAVIICFILMFH